MTITTTTRYLHWILDRLEDKADVPAADVERIRKFLPEIPKHPTLEELAAEVENASGYVSGNYWSPEISLENWLDRLARDLNGLADESLKKGKPAHPALPAGLRIADHEEYGRVVVSPNVDVDGDHLVFFLDERCETGANRKWVHLDTLSFIDAEPAHPEFLETEADYKNAPEGTIVARDGMDSWVRGEGVWVQGPSELPYLKGPRRVLRWGWGND